MTRLQTTAGLLARRGFLDADRAERWLAIWPARCEPLIDLIAASPDPDLALAGLVRLTDRVPDLPDRLVDQPMLAHQLIMVLGASLALQQHLVRTPEHIELLTTPCRRSPADAWRTSFLAAVGADPATQVPVASRLSGDELRTEYRGAVLQVAARDLCAPEALEVVEDVAAELADLADAALEAALAVARGQVGAEALGCRLAVVALGKCGGRELNYVSDVDVLFVAEPALDGEGSPVVDADQAVTAATRLAAAMTRICSAHTAAGTIWQVDAALRPEGRAGPLVRTLASMRSYYGQWAKTWEFQAMLKARPAAGDRDLGTEFVDLVWPQVWQVADHDHFVDDVRAMRRRVVDHLPSKEAGRELKLGSGGLRDVEFSVQLLQLVHGRADERVRTSATLPGLRLLVELGYVGRDAGKEFGLAYRFMRALEHRIQLFRLRRTHLVPDDDTDLRRIGRSLGYADPVSSLLETWRHTAQRVRRMHERLFYSPLLEAVAQISPDELRLTTSAATDRLRALGYADPKAALQHIAALSHGITRQAEIQRQLLPVMLGWFADAPNPDHGLLAFRQVSEALGSSPWYLRALRDEGAMAQRLATILASGRYVVGLLLRSPQNVQMLVEDAEITPRTMADLVAAMTSAAKRHDSVPAKIEAIRGIRRRELFRVAVGDLLGLNDVPAVAEALTDITAAAVHTALSVVRADTEGAPELAVVAMGRWGGRELSYGSDADAMIVMADAEPAVDGAQRSDQAGRADHDQGGSDLVKIASQVFTRTRTELAKPGPEPALVMDTNLRPEGKGGAEIRSLTAYRSYYRRWSSTWELQALVRAEALAGDPDLGAALMKIIDAHRWPDNGLTPTQIAEIRRLKARMEAERLPRGADPRRHIKLGPGGLSDVEWTVQLIQLRHAHRVAALRTPMTLTALRAAVADGLIDADDAAALTDAWLFASRLRNQIMLVRGKATDSLPTDNRELSAVAELMGYQAGRASHIVADYGRITRRSRTVVDRLFWGEH